MGFLRRVFGGRPAEGSGNGDAGEGAAATDAGPPVDLDAEERARELELARFDQDRVDDLVRRQQRYADRKWTPPTQGGTRRSDDQESAAD